ncbi:hypothetical protein [Mangrovibacterium sp.]
MQDQLTLIQFRQVRNELRLFTAVWRWTAQHNRRARLAKRRKSTSKNVFA